MKNDKAPNPIHVCLLGADAVVLYPQMPAHPIEQFWLSGAGLLVRIDPVAEGVIQSGLSVAEA